MEHLDTVHVPRCGLILQRRQCRRVIVSKLQYKPLIYLSVESECKGHPKLIKYPPVLRTEISTVSFLGRPLKPPLSDHVQQQC